VIPGVYLSLFVSKITQKVTGGFDSNFRKAQLRGDKILLVIRISI